MAASRAPISPASELCRRPRRPYSEVDGHAVVVIPERRAFVELPPRAVALWAALDGRPLAAVVGGLTSRTGDPVIATAEAIELVRRWRALDLVEERAVLGAEGGGADDEPELARLDPDAEPPSAPRLEWRTPSTAEAPSPDEDDAVAWFGALLSWVSDDDLAAPGLADALAGLAERPDARRQVAARLFGEA
jgi:hypothetical protein